MTMTRAEKLRSLRQYLTWLAPGGQIGELLRSTGAEALGGAAFEAQAAPALREQARAGLEQLSLHSDGRGLTEEQLLAVEAIILPRERPAVLIQNNTYHIPPAPWTHYASPPIRQRLHAVIPSVACIEVPQHPKGPLQGTGFVVGPDLILTNRHVAEAFASGLGRQVRLNYGPGVRANFRGEFQNPQSDNVAIDRVLMIHPHWDMALLRAPGVGRTHQPLRLSTEHPDQLGEREIAVIGYPALDSRNDLDLQREIFDHKFGVKRLQPGRLRGRVSIRDHYGHQVNVLTHDSSTLGGNSGSAVIDVRSGLVLGLHFAGQYKRANYAVPAWELARDRHVVAAGVLFAGRVAGEPEWMPAWRGLEQGRPEAAQLPASNLLTTTADPQGVRPTPGSPRSAPTVIAIQIVTPSEVTVSGDGVIPRSTGEGRTWEVNAAAPVQIRLEIRQPGDAPSR